MNYIILYSSIKKSLEKLIKEHLKKEWKIYQQINTTPMEHKFKLYYQIMRKYEISNKRRDSSKNNFIPKPM